MDSLREMATYAAELRVRVRELEAWQAQATAEFAKLGQLVIGEPEAKPDVPLVAAVQAILTRLRERGA